MYQTQRSSHAKPARLLPQALAWLLLTAATVWAADTNPVPRIACEVPVYDFGEHDNSSDLDYTFTIANTGAAPLVVSQVRPGCGCMKAQIATNTIPPGGTAPLQTRICLRGYNGPKRTSIYVHSNDPVNGVYQLLVTGKAISEIEVEPRSLSFECRSGEKPQERSVRVVNKSSAPLRVTRWECSCSFFSAAVTTNEAGRSYSVAVTTASNILSESYQGVLSLLTDHPRYPRMDIQLSAAAKPDLMVLPAQVLLRESVSNQPQTRYVVLRSAEHKEFHVTGVRSSSAAMPVAVQSAKATWVRIRVGPFVPSSSLSNEVITVNTDLKGAETVSIPVRHVPDASPGS